MAERNGSGRSISAKQVVVGLLILVVVVLALVNSSKVPVDFVVGEVEMRLFVVIVVAAVIGWVIGWFMGRSRKAG